MRRTLAIACALALVAAPSAIAQDPQDPLGDAPPLVDRPPVVVPEAPDPEPGEPGEPAGTTPEADPGATTPVPPAQAGELPDTGADARLVALLGAGVLLLGVGLRLRTADDRF